MAKKLEKKVIRKVEKTKSAPKNKKIVAPQKAHSWRLCPQGEHSVKTHPMMVPASDKYPEGHTTTRHCHCAKNPSGKDQLYPEEIQEIARRHFLRLKKGPCSLDLGFHENGSKFDPLIAGWVKYWNEVLEPTPPLDPNLVKALLASESSFEPKLLANKKDSNSARGLLQVTDDSRKILGDEKGELKNHFLTVTKEDLNSPTVNICAGIRWLFQKRALASAKLARLATWEEAVTEYKSLSKDLKRGQPRAKQLMARFFEYLRTLEKCE